MAIRIFNSYITKMYGSGDCDDQTINDLIFTTADIRGHVGNSTCGIETSNIFSNAALQIKVTPAVWTLESGSDIKYEFVLKQDGMYYDDRDITTGEYKLGFAASNAPDMNIEDWNNATDVFSDFTIKDGSDYTSSHIHFYDGTSSVTLSYNDDIIPATSASSAQPHYIDFNLEEGWLKNLDNSNYNFIQNATTLVATASVVQPTITDYPTTYNAGRGNLYLYDRPTQTFGNLYLVSESFDGTTGNWYSDTAAASQTKNYYGHTFPLRLGDYIYESADGDIRDTVSRVMGLGNIVINGYRTFVYGGQNNSTAKFLPWRYGRISKGRVTTIWYNGNREYPNWNPTITNIHSGSYEWTVDSVDNSRLRTFMVQASSGWWYEWTGRGTTTLRSVVEPTLAVTESGDSGTDFTQGTFYSSTNDNKFGDLSNGWVKETVDTYNGTDDAPSNNSTTQTDIYYLPSGSERDFKTLPLFNNTGSFDGGEEEFLRWYNDTDPTIGSKNGNVFDSAGNVEFHKKVDVRYNAYIRYNDLMYCELDGQGIINSGPFQFTTSPQVTTIGTFRIGTDINGNIVSGSSTNQGYKYTSSELFTVDTSNKWPTNNDTIRYLTGPNSGSALTGIDNQYIHIYLGEVPTTDYPINSQYSRYAYLNTSGVVGLVGGTVS